jgi:hypothetical protein
MKEEYLTSRRECTMKKVHSKKLSVLAFVLVLALSLALTGCSSPAPASSDSSGSSDTDTGSGSSATASSGASQSSGSGSGSTATVKLDSIWLGDWTSQNEISAPDYAMAEQKDNTDCKLTIEEDGSWVFTENGTEKYSGVATPFETTYYQGETGTEETDLKTTVDGKTVYLRLVNAQGINKLIWNCGTGAQGGGAGASGDGTLPKYTFI